VLEAKRLVDTLKQLGRIRHKWRLSVRGGDGSASHC
jgi:hypothetical protein